MQRSVLGEWELQGLYDVVSLERSKGRGDYMTYHEYVAAAMKDRVDVNSGRLDLIFSYLDPGNSHTDTYTYPAVKSMPVCYSSFVLYSYQRSS